MQPALRLAIRNLLARPERALLLIGAVALSAALITAVATAMSSVTGSIRERIMSTVGAADVKLQPMQGDTLPAEWLASMRELDDVVVATPRLLGALSLTTEIERWVDDGTGTYRGVTSRRFASAMGTGIDPLTEPEVRPVPLVAGRLPEGPNEIVLDELLADRLAGIDRAAGMMGSAIGNIVGEDVVEPVAEQERTGGVDAARAEALNGAIRVGVGSTVSVRRLLRSSIDLEVVGIIEQPPLGGRATAYMTLDGLGRLVGREGRVTDIEAVVRGDPLEFIAELAPKVEGRALLQTTARITSGLEGNMSASRLGFLIATMMTFLSAAFIITTGMSVDLAQRQRELATIRCIGGSRRQLAVMQLATGAAIGLLGAIPGVPLGLGLAAILISMLAEQFGAGLVLPTWGLLIAVLGAVVSGVIGAAVPAVRASRMSPLTAMRSRAGSARPGRVAAAGLIGALGPLTQLALISLDASATVKFWLYIVVGMPLMIAGYFALGPALVSLLTRVFGGVVSRAFGVPASLSTRSILRTPYRFGFIAGAMMLGVGLMLSIWINGTSVNKNWLQRLQFPELFVFGLNLSEASEAKLDAMEGVRGTVPITLHTIETDVFGVEGFTRYRSTFMAFEPEEFFGMAKLDWVEGEPETAVPKLEAGGAIIVAREFQVARGLGVGDTFTCWNPDAPDDEIEAFEIVGVVTSPGLEIVNTFFNIGENYTDQALHAVFGSRKDLKERFGSEAVTLIQVDLEPEADDEALIEQIKRDLFEEGILDVGSGRAIKEQISTLLGGVLGVFTMVALGSITVATLGVMNLVIAGVESRKFEFGVLRSMGASRGVLAKLVLVEGLIVGVVASLLGTGVGVQAANTARVLNAGLAGLDIQTSLPPWAFMTGWSITIGAAVLAAVPAALTITRAPSRELLAYED